VIQPEKSTCRAGNIGRQHKYSPRGMEDYSFSRQRCALLHGMLMIPHPSFRIRSRQTKTGHSSATVIRSSRIHHMRRSKSPRDHSGTRTSGASLRGATPADKFAWVGGDDSLPRWLREPAETPPKAKPMRGGVGAARGSLLSRARLAAAAAATAAATAATAAQPAAAAATTTAATESDRAAVAPRRWRERWRGHTAAARIWPSPLPPPLRWRGKVGASGAAEESTGAASRLGQVLPRQPPHPATCAHSGADDRHASLPR